MESSGSDFPGRQLRCPCSQRRHLAAAVLMLFGDACRRFCKYLMDVLGPRHAVVTATVPDSAQHLASCAPVQGCRVLLGPLMTVVQCGRRASAQGERCARHARRLLPEADACKLSVSAGAELESIPGVSVLYRFTRDGPGHSASAGKAAQQPWIRAALPPLVRSAPRWRLLTLHSPCCCPGLGSR